MQHHINWRGIAFNVGTAAASLVVAGCLAGLVAAYAVSHIAPELWP